MSDEHSDDNHWNGIGSHQGDAMTVISRRDLSRIFEMFSGLDRNAGGNDNFARMRDCEDYFQLAFARHPIWEVKT